MIPSMIQPPPLDLLLLWYQCEALQLVAHLGVVDGVVQTMRVAGEVTLMIGIDLLLLVPGQDGVNIETMGIETNILVECLVHMVVDEAVMVLEEDVMVDGDGVEVLITIEDRTPVMKGRTLVMGADGALIIQRTRMI